MVSAARPRVRVRPATPADAGVITRTRFAAFGNPSLLAVLHPGGVTDDARNKYAASLFPATDSKTASSGDMLLVVAELLPEDGPEDGPGEVIAYGKWMAYRTPRREEEWNVTKEMTSEMLGEGADPDMYNAFLGGAQKVRQRHMGGDPGLLLSSLATNPERERLGAGSAILRWGTELADKEGLVSWLESSAPGYPLYLRHGFKAVDVLDLNITELCGVVNDGTDDWGSRSATETFGPLKEGARRTVIMRREPQKQGTSS